MIDFFIHFLGSFISSFSFGILTNNPKKSLFYCGIVGASGWTVFWKLNGLSYGLGLSNFIAALLIGILSILFSKIKKMPITIFNMPGLVSLVPGGPAYKVVREILLNCPDKAIESFSTVIITAGALASGFLLTSVLEKIFFSYFDQLLNFFKNEI